MMNIKSLAAGLLTGAFFIGQVFAQGAGQIGPGQVWGNPSAAQGVASPSNVTAILDRALGSTRGAILERGSAGWVIVAPSATAGLAWVSAGTGADPLYGVISMAGGGCGAAITAANGGIFYSTASACALLAPTATARLPLLSGANAAPIWGAFTLPASVTSGGIPFFSSTTVMGSSALLAANQLIIGGGAGVAPASISFTASQIMLGGAPPTTLVCATATTVVHGGTPPTCSQVSLTADVTGILPGANGGTNSAFFQVAGPATSLKTYTFPNSSQTMAALDLASQVVSGGATVTTLAQSTGNITADCGARPLQSITNGGAFTITAPAADGSCVIKVTNNASAGIITFSGFSVGSNIGATLTTVNGNIFFIQVQRIGGSSTYSVVALQ